MIQQSDERRRRATRANPQPGSRNAQARPARLTVPLDADVIGTYTEKCWPIFVKSAGRMGLRFVVIGE